MTGFTADGCAGEGPDEHPLTARAAFDTADVRCCSQDGSTCASQNFEGGVDYVRNGNVHSSGCMFENKKTISEARDICAAAGSRLCAPHEVEVCCGTGCWQNLAAVWVDPAFVGSTVDGCSSVNSNSNSTKGDQSGGLIPPSSSAEMAVVRCCSFDGSSCASTVGGECHDVVSFLDAQMICSAAGQRLCFQVEMDTCCGTGCWYDHFAVWTSDSV